MKTQRILLEITYDENETHEPANWDWDSLLDLAAHEEVQVVEVDGATWAAFDVKTIQSLLKSKTADGLKAALSLLDSLGATEAERVAVFTDRVMSSIVCDHEVSADTVQQWEQLIGSMRVFPTLVARFGQHARKAAKQHEGDLSLDGLSTLSAEVAEALARHKDDLYLGGLTTLSDDAAKALARHKGGLVLNGLTTLSDEAAKALAQHKGWLDLNGLTTLSDEAAKAVAERKGELYLHGLTTLTDDGAKVLRANPNIELPDKFNR